MLRYTYEFKKYRNITLIIKPIFMQEKIFKNCPMVGRMAKRNSPQCLNTVKITRQKKNYSKSTS